MAGEVTVHLEVYVPLQGARRWTGTASVPAGTTVAELPALVGLAEPDLVTLINGRNAAPDRVLAEGDQVVILRPSEGG